MTKKKNTFTRMQRIAALALALVMCITLLPVNGLSAFAVTQVNAAGTLGVISTADDPSTATRPNDVFMDGSKGSTLNAGKILVGKSVNDGTEGGAATPVNLRSELFNMPQYATDANYGQFLPGEAGNFLVTISQSSQMYGVSNNIPLPMDVVFVLDTSGSMAWAADSRNNRAQAVVDAANAAISTILGMNEHNRIAVVGFSDSASTMSELRHYEDTTGGYGAGNKAATQHLTWSNSDNRSGNIRGRNTSGEAANGRNGTNGGTNIQDGILMGAKILTNVAANDTYIMMDTDGDGNEERITRMPILVVLSDGAATYSEEDAEWWDANGNRQGPGGDAYAGNGFLAALTAAYYKNVITQKYYGANATESAAVYTIGVGLGSITNGTASVPNTNTSVDDVTLAHWTMDPSAWLGGSVTNSTIDDDFNGYWTSYTAAAAATQKREFSVEVNNNDYYDFCNQSGSETYTEMEWQRVNVGTYWNPRWEWQEVEVEKTRTWTDNIQESVTDLKYNDDYWAASSTEEISGAFKNLVSAIQKRAVTAPTLTDVNFGDNYSGFVTFTDPIGEYMEVKRVLGVTGGGYMYQGRHMGELAEGYNPNWENETTSEVQAAFNAAFEQAMMDRIRVSTAAGGALPTLAQVRSILDVITRTQTEGNVSYNAGGGNVRLFDWDTYGGQMYYNSDEDYGNSFVWFGKVHYPEGNTEEAANEPYDVQFIGVAPKYADSAEWLHTNDNAALLDSAKAAGANCVVRSYFMYGTADGVQTEGASEMLHFQVRVMTSLAEPHQQYVSIKAPASLLAMQTVLIDESDPDNLVANYDELIPSRVVYEVGLRSDIDANNVWNIVEDDYLTETLADGTLANVNPDGTINFYTNDWDREATIASHTRALAHANFEVADNNTFYRYETDTLLVDANGDAITSEPAAGNTYYYSRTYYTWTPEEDGSSAATKGTKLIAITWPGDVTAKVVDSKYYIPAGLYTGHTITSGDDLPKQPNTTNTASVVTHPERTGSAADNGYTTWLGNNGKLVFNGVKPKSVTGTSVDGTTGEIDGKAVKAGDVLTYTLSAVNTTGAAAKVVITDTIPEGTALVDGSIAATVNGTPVPGTGTVTGDVITWTISDVADKAVVKATFQVTVLESAVAVGTVDNQATIKVGENTYTTNITTNPVTGKQATNVDDTPINVGGVKIGDAVEFHIAFINTTGETANIVVKDTVPQGTYFAGETSHKDELTVNGNELTWTFKNVAPGAHGVVSFTVYVDAGVETIPGKDLGIENTAAYTINVDNAPAVEIETNPVEVKVKSGDLQVSKIVTGTNADKVFELTLTETTGKLNGTFTMTGSSQNQNDVTFENGVSKVAVKIKAGERLEIKGLPVGVTVKTSENVPAGYTESYAPDDTVTVVEGTTPISIEVTNTYSAENTDDISTMFMVRKTLSSPVLLGTRNFVFKAQPVQVETENGVTVYVADDGDALIANGSVGVAEGGTAGTVTFAFTGKTFDTPYVYYYEVSEVEGVLDGITYDKTKYLVEITVSDNEKGKLEAKTRFSKYDAAAQGYKDWVTVNNIETDLLNFVNSYTPSDVEVILTGTKTLTGRDMIANEFTFQLTETSAPAGVDRTVIRYGTNDANGTITFDPIYYSVVGTYTYDIVELKTTGQDHMSFDEVVEKVTVTVSANNDGVLSTSVAYDTTDADPGEIKFGNTYTTQDVIYTPAATKTLTGNAMNAGEFTFAVFGYNEGTEGSQVSTGRITTGAASGESVNISFSPITYSLDSFTDGRPTEDKSETFTYLLRELLPTTGTSDRVTYDRSAFTFTVTLHYDASSGKLEAVFNHDMQRIRDKDGNTVTTTPADAAFNNVYTPEGITIDVTPNVTKTVVGKTSETTVPAGLSFGFQIVKAAQAVFADGTTDQGWYPGDNDNTRFTVGAVVGAGTSNATVEGNTSAPANVSFGPLHFYEPGIYKAWIVENNAGVTLHGVEHDSNRYLMVITVTQNVVNGTLEAAVKYYKGAGTDLSGYAEEIIPADTTPLSFTNTYSAAGSMTITAKKVLENRGDKRVFNFTLTEVGGSGTVHTGTNDPDSGLIVFDTLIFDGEDMGTAATEAEKQYIMAEVPSSIPGIIYDKSQYQLTVKLTSTGGVITGEVSKIVQIADKDGNAINVDVTETSGTGVVFTNVGTVYQGTDIEFRLSKVLNGRDMKASEFGFALIHVSTQTPDNTVTPVNQQVDGAVVPAANQGEKVTMTIKRTYSASVQPGTVITYRLAELPGNLDGVTYDESVYEIKVKITDDNKDGILEAAVISKQLISKDNEGKEIFTDITDEVFAFTNTYKAASTTYSLTGTKTMIGRDMEAGEFVFEVYEDSFTPAGSDTPTRVNSGVVTTGRNDADTDGTASAFTFDPITYHEAGTYAYHVVERAGNRNGVTYSLAEYDVVVKVTDDGNGTLSAAVVSINQVKNDAGQPAADGKTIAFSNTYTPEHLNLAPYLEIGKVLTGRDMTNDEFDFVVTMIQKAGKMLEKEKHEVVSYGSNAAAADGVPGNVSFASFTVSEAGEYKFTITESDTAAPGVDTDGRTITVTIVVKDDGHGKLFVAENGVSYTDSDDKPATDAQTFYNTYKPDNVRTSFTINKTLIGKNLDKETFTFVVGLTKGNVPQTLNKTTVSTKEGDKSVVYEADPYTAPGTYVWTITEVKGDENVGNGTMTYDTAKYTITEVVRDNTATGKLEIVSSTMKKDGADASAITFTNTYTPDPVVQNLDVVMDAPQDKTLTGRDMVAGEFDFVVKDLQGNKVATGTNDAAGNIVLTYLNVPDGLEAGIPFTSAGTYYFTVSEVAGTTSSVTYDPTVWTVRIDVHYNSAEGKLIADPPVITDVKERAVVAAEDITFVNVYDPVDATVELKGSKVLNLDHSATNRVMIPGEFEFHLLNSAGSVVAKGFNDKDGNIVFEKLTFSAPTDGELKFTIVEVDKGAVGVTYSDAKYKVGIEIKDDPEKGELVPTVTITDENNVPVNGEWIYVNSYKGLPTHAVVAASKNLVGKDLTEGEFSFELKPVEKPVGAADVVITGGTNAADGSIAFRVENLTENGRYTFEMTEVEGPDDNVIYSKQTYTVHIDVTDSGSGYKNAEVIYQGDTAPVFNNTYNPDPVVVTVDADKVMTGNRTTVKDNEFKFEVRNEANDVVATGKTKADGSIDFDYGTGKTGIEIYTVGTFAYTITEVEPDKNSEDYVPGVKYDEAVWTITVKTEYNEATGVLSKTSEVITVTGSEADPTDGIVFTNEYDPIDAKVILKGEKTLSGRELTDEEFTFRLLDADQNVVHEVKNGQYGEIEEIIFPALVYTKPTTAPEVYTIVEVDEGDTGVGYSAVVYTVTIEVKDNAAIGELIPTVTITDENDEPVTDWSFANSYKGLPATAVVEAIKNLDGKPLTDGEFNFQLVEKAGNPVQATPVVVTGGTNAADGSITFNVENLTEEGRYTFVMSEVVGDDDNVTYSDKSYEVYIDVEDLKDGSMKATVTYKDVVVPEFVNIYTPDPAEVTIKADKTLSGREMKAGEFQFVIKDENGVKLADGTNDANGKIVFTAFKLGACEGKKLYISEVKGDDKNVTYDSKVYILSVDVINENEAGMLVPVVHYPVDGVVFNNNYVPDMPGNEPSPIEPAPVTSDNSNPNMWVLIMAFSVFCMVPCITNISKKRRNDFTR